MAYPIESKLLHRLDRKLALFLALSIHHDVVSNLCFTTDRTVTFFASFYEKHDEQHWWTPKCPKYTLKWDKSTLYFGTRVCFQHRWWLRWSVFDAMSFIGKKTKTIKRVTIVIGSPTALTSCSEIRCFHEYFEKIPRDTLNFICTPNSFVFGIMLSPYFSSAPLCF